MATMGTVGRAATVVIAAAALALPTLAFGSYAARTTWTTAQAQQRTQATTMQFQLSSGDGVWIPQLLSGNASADPTAISACHGVGKGVKGRYTSFRCRMKARTVDKVPPLSAVKTLWIKVRQQGTGQVCASLTGLSAIPTGCLKASGTRSDSIQRFDAWEAAAAWVSVWKEQHPIQSGQQLRIGQGGLRGYGAGYFDFTWTLNDFTGSGAVLETHSLTMVFTRAWTKPRGPGCFGSGCPPTPGLRIVQTS